MTAIVPPPPVLPRRLDYVVAALNLINTPYQIGGRLRPAHGDTPADFGVDCAGLAEAALKALGGPDLSDWWTLRFWNELPPIDPGDAKLGDVFLYATPVGHLTIAIGNGACLSASFGTHACTTREISAALDGGRGARVIAHSSYLYRPDFVGARSMARFLS